MPSRTIDPSGYNRKVLSGTFGVIVLLICAIFKPNPAAPLEEMKEGKFIRMVETGQIVSTSGQPLERQTDRVTGQQYLKGVYYVNQPTMFRSYSTMIRFRVAVSPDPTDEALNTVRKANMEVVDSSDPLQVNPAVRRYLLIGVLVVFLSWWIRLFLREWRRKAVASTTG